MGEAERRKHRQPRQIRKEAAVTVATGVQLLFLYMIKALPKPKYGFRRALFLEC